MKTNFIRFFLLPVVLFAGKSGIAQYDSLKKSPSVKIAVFAPLYLDSIFNENGFRYKQGIPRFMSPALEFVQGAQTALDSLPPANQNIEVSIYDSKSYTQPIPWLISNHKLDSLDMIIGAVKDADYRQLADLALLRKIPFISATYPNDGGITANPYVVIVNSTLRSHCDAIYSYILQNHGTDNIYLFRQKGTQEDMVASYFKQKNELDGKPLLNIQTVNVNADPTADFIRSKLDSNRQSVVIGGSLEENFSSKLIMACNSLKGHYPIKLIGMPTWDGFAVLHKKSGLDDFPVYYTTSYCNSKSDDHSRVLINAYNKKYKGKPSDMAFKGYEMMSLFAALANKYPHDLFNHINDPQFRVFNEFNFRPVILQKNNTRPDYLENKHLYFIKNINGVVSKAW